MAQKNPVWRTVPTYSPKREQTRASLGPTAIRPQRTKIPAMNAGTMKNGIRNGMPARINAGMITAGEATSKSPIHNRPQPEIGCRGTSVIVTAGLGDWFGVFEFMDLSGKEGEAVPHHGFLKDIIMITHYPAASNCSLSWAPQLAAVSQ